MRRPLIAANWKMHHLTQDALRFAERLPEACDRCTDVDLAVFPPSTLISTLSRALSGTRVRIGGQTCHEAREGAFTGELSAAQLSDVGCSMVLVGHSERRRLFGETDRRVRLKLHAALEVGLEPVLCVGETEEEREANDTDAVLDRQLTTALEGLGDDACRSLVVAYEPVWAIGTGRTATPGIAQAAHAFVRTRLTELFGRRSAEAIRILYGGSVKPDNVRELTGMPDIDGGLVGGASLDPESYVSLVGGASRLGPRPV